MTALLLETVAVRVTVEVLRVVDGLTLLTTCLTAAGCFLDDCLQEQAMF